MIRFPNKFKGINFTMMVEFETETDITKLYDDIEELDTDILNQLRKIKNFSITFAKMNSSINKDKYIDYTEVIIKIPISILGENYIFPIATFVSNEYSLIRGYLMGFHKIFSMNTCFTSNHVGINHSELIDIELVFDLEKFKENTHLSKESEKFLLFRNFLVDRQTKDQIVLKTEDYKLGYNKYLEIEPQNVGIILEKKIKATRLLYSEDSFEITGLIKV
jgi:hypothetical protein